MNKRLVIKNSFEPSNIVVASVASELGFQAIFLVDMNLCILCFGSFLDIFDRPVVLDIDVLRFVDEKDSYL